MQGNPAALLLAYDEDFTGFAGGRPVDGMFGGWPAGVATGATGGTVDPDGYYEDFSAQLDTFVQAYPRLGGGDGAALDVIDGYEDSSSDDEPADEFADGSDDEPAGGFAVPEPEPEPAPACDHCADTLARLSDFIQDIGPASHTGGELVPADEAPCGGYMDESESELSTSYPFQAELFAPGGILEHVVPV
jgi:hypothetical protein